MHMLLHFHLTNSSIPHAPYPHCTGTTQKILADHTGLWYGKVNSEHFGCTAVILSYTNDCNALPTGSFTVQVVKKTGVYCPKLIDIFRQLGPSQDKSMAGDTRTVKA